MIGAEVKSAVARVIAYPNAWPYFTRDTRRCALRRFPYSIIFRAAAAEVVILAVMHQSRSPERWDERAG